MKTLAVTISMALFLAMKCVAEDGHEAALKMAPIIKYFVDDKGIHHYSIPIAYQDTDAESIGYLTEYNKEILAVDYLTKKDGFSFSTRRKLTGQELMGIYHSIAWGMGDVPNWVELVLLSKAKAKQYSPSAYKLMIVEKNEIEKTLKQHKVDLSNFIAVRRNCFALELIMTKESNQKLIVNSRSARCMGHDNYSLRIVNEEGQIIWQDLKTLGGDLKYLQIDIDDDEDKEILFHQDDHGAESLVVLDPTENK